MKVPIIGYKIVAFITDDDGYRGMPFFYRLMSYFGFLVWSREWISYPVYGVDNVQQRHTEYRLAKLKDQIHFIRTRGERKRDAQELIRRMEQRDAA